MGSHFLRNHDSAASDRITYDIDIDIYNFGDLCSQHGVRCLYRVRRFRFKTRFASVSHVLAKFSHQFFSLLFSSHIFLFASFRFRIFLFASVSTFSEMHLLDALSAYLQKMEDIKLLLHKGAVLEYFFDQPNTYIEDEKIRKINLTKQNKIFCRDITP